MLRKCHPMDIRKLILYFSFALREMCVCDVRTTVRRRRSTSPTRTSANTLRCQSACSTATDVTLARSPADESRSSRNRARRNSRSRTPTVSSRMCSETLQFRIIGAAKLVAALLRVAGVTVGLAESNGSYRRAYDLRHPQADCKEPGSAPEPYAR